MVKSLTVYDESYNAPVTVYDVLYSPSVMGSVIHVCCFRGYACHVSGGEGGCKFLLLDASEIFSDRVSQNVEYSQYASLHPRF